jgi:23S rRNA pseudouridine2605 synthase
MNTKKSPTPPGERLQKVLANLGLGSRREIERWIAAGRVAVNGETAKLGDRVTDKDSILVDQKPVRTGRNRKMEHRVIVYNKPEGELVTRDDPEGRPTVFKRLPRLKTGRWIAVGRLDINSSGLMIFTTDGQLANRLMHPSQQVEREYSVRVLGEVSEKMLETLVNGVELEDGPARFEEIVESGGEGANRWFHVVIMEGRNREVRRLWDAVGVTVNRLKRVRFGPIFLGSLAVGKSRELEEKELEELLQTVAPQEKPKPRRKFAKAKPARPARPEQGKGNDIYKGPSKGRRR